MAGTLLHGVRRYLTGVSTAVSSLANVFLMEVVLMGLLFFLGFFGHLSRAGGQPRPPGSALRRAQAPQVWTPLKLPLLPTGFPAEIHVAKKVPICFNYFLTTPLACAFGLAGTQMGNFGTICAHALVLKAQSSVSSGTYKRLVGINN